MCVFGSKNLWIYSFVLFFTNSTWATSVFMIRNETTVEPRKKTTWFMMSSLQALWNFPEDRRAPVKVEVGPCGTAERKE